MNLRLRLALLFAFSLALMCGSRASAACGSLPYVFSNSVSIVDATTTNSNNQFLVQCATNVDNTQIGAAGIFASQILPSSVATGTFGGSYPFTFALTSPSQVPLSIVGAASQTSDLFDVWSNAHASHLFYIDSAGGAHYLTLTGGAITATTVTASGAISAASLTLTGGPLPVVQGGTGSATQNFVDLSSAQTVGGAKTLTAPLVITSIPGATDGLSLLTTNTVTHVLDDGTASNKLYFEVGNASFSTNTGNLYFSSAAATSLVSFNINATNTYINGNASANGTVEATSNGSTLSYIPPVYTAGGAAVASTVHFITGSCSTTSGSCTIAVTGTVNSVLSCSATIPSAAVPQGVAMGTGVNPAITVYLYKVSSGAVQQDASSGVTISAACLVT